MYIAVSGKVTQVAFAESAAPVATTSWLKRERDDIPDTSSEEPPASRARFFCSIRLVALPGPVGLSGNSTPVFTTQFDDNGNAPSREVSLHLLGILSLS